MGRVEIRLLLKRHEKGSGQSQPTPGTNGDGGFRLSVTQSIERDHTYRWISTKLSP